MQTAKTIQLRDGSNNYISPATNIESLYYEMVGTDENQNVIYRHSISQYFPVYVNYGNDTQTTDNYLIAPSDTNILDISTKYTKIVDDQGNDIIISNFIQRRLKGTNYYALDVSQYNLSVMLQSYAGLSYTENRILNLSTYIQARYDITINIINSIFSNLQVQIDDVSSNAATLDNKIGLLQDAISYNTIHTYEQLKKYKKTNQLIAGANYRMIYDPYNDISNNMYYPNKFNIVLNALDNSTFDTDVVSCMVDPNYQEYFEDNNLELWVAKFDFDKKIDAGYVQYNSSTFNQGDHSLFVNLVSTNNQQQLIVVKSIYIDTSNNGIIQLNQDASTANWINFKPKTESTETLNAGSYLYIEQIGSIIKNRYYQKSINGSIFEIYENEIDFPSGEIVYLKDEYGNEAPFDFKNKKQQKNIGSYSTKQYLFARTINNDIIDYSNNPLCHDNIIKSDKDIIMFDINSSIELYNNYIGYNSNNVLIKATSNSSLPIYNNTIQNDNYGVYLTSDSSNNTSIYYCSNNVIGHDNYSIYITASYNNTIGDNNIDINIGSGADNNELGSGCNKITIDKEAKYNIIECNNSSAKINQYASYNVVEQGCYNWSINTSVSGVTIGPYARAVQIEKSNMFYTYQTIYARGFESKW